MPSGSHGGSGGSHFGGGGSHFGGGSSFRGGSSISFSRGTRPIRTRRIVILGRPYVFTSGGKNGSRFSFFGVLIFVALFFMLIGGVVIAAEKSSIQRIEEDHAYYIDMINYAKENPEYKKEAIITDKFQSDNNNYYLTYKIACASCTEGYLNGYTFSVYTREEVRNFHIDDVIEVAVNSKTVTSTTDSIPMDYAETPIDADGEWVGSRNGMKIGTGIVIVTGVIAALGVVGIVYTFKKALKKEEESKIAEAAEKEMESLKNTCPYCGQLLKEGTVKCPNCGAGLKRK